MTVGNAWIHINDIRGTRQPRVIEGALQQNIYGNGLVYQYNPIILSVLSQWGKGTKGTLNTSYL